MEQTRDEITENLAERLGWDVARRDDRRVARRLYRQQVVDGVYRLAAGARLDDFCSCLQAIGVMPLLEQVHGVAIHRAMVPFVQDCPAVWGEEPVWDEAHQGPAHSAVQR